MHKPVTWPLVRGAEIEERAGELSQAELLELEAAYCSHGDTVHYTDPPKIIEHCRTQPARHFPNRTERPLR